MEKKIMLILNLVTTTLLIVTLFTVSFAWYTNSNDTNGFTMQTAKIASKVTLYRGLDFDRDGFLDQELVGGSYIDKYEEIEKIVDAGDASKTYYANITFDDVVPTETFTWKLNVENNGDVNGYFRLNVADTVINNKHILEYFKFFRLEIFSSAYSSMDVIYIQDVINSLNNTTSQTRVPNSTTYYPDNTIETAKEFVIFTDDASSIPFTKPNNKRDYIFTFRMMSMDEYAAKNNVTVESFAAEYQSLQGTSFSANKANIFLNTVLSSESYETTING